MFRILLRWSLWVCAVGVVCHALAVLAYVGTSPDVGLRVLLVDDQSQAGPRIASVTPLLRSRGNARPEAGDVLVGMGPSRKRGLRHQPIRTFVDFTWALSALRNAPPVDGILHAGSDPSELQDPPPFVEIEGTNWFDRERWVEIEFLRAGHPEPLRTWLHVHSLPGRGLVMSFVWFVLEMLILGIGGLAFWKRPFDRQARLFFAMCVVTLGAFVGGYHWWVLAGSTLLNIPFIISAVLVPAVTLHFFLSYPAPKRSLVEAPGQTVALIYLLPVVSIGVLVWQVLRLNHLHQNDRPAADLVAGLFTMRGWILAYLVVAAGYFCVTIYALINSFTHARNPFEHSQVKWILVAAMVATVPVGYTLFLALFHRVEFAMGEGAIPMFIASLLFMVAYAVGIARYRLMLIEQLVSRELLFFLASLGVTASYSLLIVLVSLFGIFQNMRSSQHAFVVSATLLMTVILLGWARDAAQKWLDRVFFREKYQLDKALHGVNRGAQALAEPAALAERLLASCRDVLLAERSAFYLRDEDHDVLRLIVQDGVAPQPLPPQIADASAALVQHVRETGARGLTPGALAHLPGAPGPLRGLDGEYIHVLELEGTIAGIVVLGPKRNGEPFSGEDLTFLTAMSDVTAVAINSSRQQRTVERLKQELVLKIEKIEDQQRQIAMLQQEVLSNHEAGSARPAAAPPLRSDLIKGSSPAVRALLDHARKVAQSESSVLIRGESGTGKEFLAQTLHENSPRRHGPMVRVHCAALSPGLLESELFGHVKGAFTGAHRDKVGRFELAHGGTLFLDEIGDISLETQVKLLRVLQQRSFEPVGGTTPVEVDVRLIAATHQPLERLIAEGRFREDLFYRLNVISLTLPPLRERVEDIFELALHFVNRAAHRLGRRFTHIDDAAVEALQRYAWPGNVRQLENVIERAVVLAETDAITLDDLPAEVARAVWEPTRHAADDATAAVPAGLSQTFLPATGARGRRRRAPRPTVADAAEGTPAERERLAAALREARGNKTEAARRLGLPRSTFFSKLKKLELE